MSGRSGATTDIPHRYTDDIYFVPDDTLMPDEAVSLGIRSANDFFGGVVAHPFVKTKAITPASPTIGWMVPADASENLSDTLTTI